MKAIYFDISDTLGSVEVSPSNRLLRVYPFTVVRDVLEELMARGVALGILSNTGVDRTTDVDRVLGNANLLHYFHSDLRIYSADVGITKRRIEMFELARGRAGRVLGGIPDVYFVGENRTERGLAKLAGLEPVPHPSLVAPVLDGERIAYVRAAYRDALRLRAPDFIPLTADLGSHSTVYLTTERAEHVARANGIRLDTLSPLSSPPLTDLYLVRDDGHDGATSSMSGKLLAVGSGATFHDGRTRLKHVISRGEPAPAFTRNTTIEPRLSNVEHKVLAETVTDTSLGDAIGRVIGEEDGIGRNRHVLSPEMFKVVERLAADLEDAGNGLIRVVLQRFELSTGRTILVEGQPLTETVPLWNVIGELEGRTKDLVLVSAHLDSTSKDSYPGTYDPKLHESPGADDDASGVAAVMCIAKAFSVLFADRKPQRTVRFLLFNAEEQGLQGSARYARLLADQKAAVAAVFQMDMIGYNGSAPNNFEVHAGTSRLPPAVNPELEERALDLARLVRGMSCHLAEHNLSQLEPAQVYPSPDPAAGHSDHASFLSIGLAACATSQDFFPGPGPNLPRDQNPQYHRAGDVEVNLPYATSIARVVGAAALRTAEPVIDGAADDDVAAPGPAVALQDDPNGPCVLFSGGNRFCAATIANLTEAQVERIAAELPKGGEDLSDEDRRVAERLLGPLDVAERTLSFSDPLERLLAVVRAMPNIDSERLKARVLDTLTSHFDPKFAVHTYATPSFDIHYQSDGAAAVDPTAEEFKIREPGTDTVLATLPESAVPSYVRRLGFWLERALGIYTSSPFSLTNPAENTRLQAFIIDAKFGGARPTGFFVGNKLPEWMLVAVTVHELLHMIQFTYDGYGRWRGALLEGGATYAEDALADRMNRYLYEAEHGFREPGLLANPNQALDDSASRYKTALFWRYLTERRSAPGVPGAGADAYRRVLEECSRSGFTLGSVERAIRQVSWGADFYRFSYDDDDGRFVANNETVWGNFAVALIARDLDRQTTDRRFRFDEDEENILFDDALQEIPLPAPSREHMTRVSRDKIQLADNAALVSAFVKNFASLYYEIDLGNSNEAVEVTVDAVSPAFRPLVQVVAVASDALVDVYRHQSSRMRRVVSTARGDQRIDRLFVVVSGTTMGGNYEMQVCGTDGEADLMITGWNCRPGLHYSIDPAHGAWTHASPDLWFVPVDKKRYFVSVRVRNQGAVTSTGIACTLDYLPGEPLEAATDWAPVLDPDGSPLVLTHRGIAAGGVEILSGFWLPTIRSSLGFYTLRVRLKEQDSGDLRATAMSRLGHETQYERIHRSTRIAQAPWRPTARDTGPSQTQHLVQGSRMSAEETQASVDTLPEPLQSLAPRFASVELAGGGSTQVAVIECENQVGSPLSRPPPRPRSPSP